MQKFAAWLSPTGEAGDLGRPELAQTITITLAVMVTLAAVLLFLTQPVVAEEAAAASGSGPTAGFLVDVSGSMRGESLSQAKEALHASVGALGPAQRAGLRAYSGRCSNGGRLLVDFGTDNRDELRGAIDELRAGGGTPTPQALRDAVEDLESDGEPATVVLVSDGQSTCGDPCPVAQSLVEESGVDFRVFSVGFRAPDAAEDELACIADVTGGQYFPADDAESLAAAIRNAIAGGEFEYVAVGDSTTTGFSAPECIEDRTRSAFGCLGDPPAIPHPQHVADRTGLTLERKGIWGYTVREAVRDHQRGVNEQGDWEPQLTSAAKARDLVSVSLGANDMDFSDVFGWLQRCVGVGQRNFFLGDWPGPVVDGTRCMDAAEERAQAPDLQDDLDAMFTVFDRAAAEGADVVTTLYYNPYNRTKHVPFLPDRDCRVVHAIGDIITGAINIELAGQANEHGFLLANLKPEFAGHGAGAADPYVFGTECEAFGLLRAAFDLRSAWSDPIEAIKRRYDPHPNDAGSKAQADAVVEIR